MKTLLSLLLALSPALAFAQVNSYIFKDVIASKGSGSIDLFSAEDRSVNVDAAMLEAFRQQHSGQLQFAVDVNEASDGSENADSQGLAIAELTLTLVVGGVTYTYTDFTTSTETLLTDASTQTVGRYYSLIGTAGSSLVTPNADSVLDGTSYDSIIRVPVDVDLSNCTQAVLDIRLLDTEVSLGDPEAYYDYSNGFENMLMINAEDAAFLEQIAPGREFAPAVIGTEDATTLNWTFYPSSDGYYLVSFEDLYPNRGDYDFNDLVAAYQVKVGQDNSGNTKVIRGSGFLVARGAAYDHDFHLGIDLPEGVTGEVSISVFDKGDHRLATGYPLTSNLNGSFQLPLIESVASYFKDGNSTYVNTYAEQNIIKGPRFEFQLTLDQPVAAEQMGSAPFDPFIYVRDTGYEVHVNGQSSRLSYSNNAATGNTSFIDDQGYPFAMILPEGWQPPLAAIDLGDAYPELLDYVTSSASQGASWYLSPQAEKIKSIPYADWRW